MGVKKELRASDEQKQLMVDLYLSGMSQIDAAKAVGFTNGVLRRELKLRGISSHNFGPLIRKHKINEHFFKTIDSENKAYWLGFIAADGCVSKDLKVLKIRLSIKDREHLEKIRTDLGSDAPITIIDTFNFGKNYQLVSINFCSKILNQDLYNLNIIPNKTLTLQTTPKNLLGDFEKDYWRGLIDGDGHIDSIRRSGRKREWRIGLTGTESITNDFTKFILDNNIKSKAKPIQVGKIWAVSFNGTLLAKQIIKLLYNDASIYLDRKKEMGYRCLFDENFD